MLVETCCCRNQNFAMDIYLKINDYINHYFYKQKTLNHHRNLRGEVAFECHFQTLGFSSILKNFFCSVGHKGFKRKIFEEFRENYYSCKWQAYLTWYTRLPIMIFLFNFEYLYYTFVHLTCMSLDRSFLMTQATCMQILTCRSRFTRKASPEPNREKM